MSHTMRRCPAKGGMVGTPLTPEEMQKMFHFFSTAEGGVPNPETAEGKVALARQAEIERELSDEIQPSAS